MDLPVGHFWRDFFPSSIWEIGGRNLVERDHITTWKTSGSTPLEMSMVLPGATKVLLDVFPNDLGFPPNHPIKKIGFSIIFTIHFGEFSSYILETPRASSATGWSIFFQLWSGQQALEHDQTGTFAGWRADHIEKRPTGRCRVFSETIVTKHVELAFCKSVGFLQSITCLTPHFG